MSAGPMAGGAPAAAPRSPALATMLEALRRRVRRAWLVSRAQVAVAVCAGAIAAAAVVRWTTRSVGATRLAAAITVFAVLAAIVGLVVGARRLHLDDARLAQLADQRLPTPEVFGAAIEFASLLGPLGDDIRARADALASSAIPSRLVPMPAHRRVLAVIAVAATVTAAASVADGPATRRARREATQAAAANAAAAQLRERATELRAADRPGANAAAVSIEQAATALESSRSIVDAAADLRTAARALDPDPARRLAALAAVKGVERDLSARPISDGASGAAQLAALARSLAGGSRLDDATADRLDALAAAARDADPELAAALAKAAAATRAGDAKAAAEAAKQAAARQQAALDAARKQADAAAAAAELRRSASQIERSRDSPAAGSSAAAPRTSVPPGATQRSGTPDAKRGAATRGDAAGSPNAPGRSSTPAGQGDGAGAGRGGGEAAPGGRGSDLRTGAPEGSLNGAGGDDVLTGDGSSSNGAVVGLANAASRQNPAIAASGAAVRTAAATSAAALAQSELAPSEERLVRSYFDALAEASRTAPVDVSTNESANESASGSAKAPR